MIAKWHWSATNNHCIEMPIIVITVSTNNAQSKQIAVINYCQVEVVMRTYIYFVYFVAGIACNVQVWQPVVCH